MIAGEGAVLSYEHPQIAEHRTMPIRVARDSATTTAVVSAEECRQRDSEALSVERDRPPNTSVDHSWCCIASQRLEQKFVELSVRLWHWTGPSNMYLSTYVFSVMSCVIERAFALILSLLD